ncbi:MAG TPA: hypothetical protein VD866_32305, partial [Urbifossiella sp.]|nr:hypothetical protein [Urbifossiella sp.]
MTRTPWLARSTALLLAAAAGCSPGGPPPDEAKTKVFGNKAATPQEMLAAAQQYYPPATADYFHDMDTASRYDGKPAAPPDLTPEQIKGRNAWVMWAGGNEPFWDWLARHSYGSIDLLKLVDSQERGKRFDRRGVITEPGTRPPTDDETREAFGVRYD